MNITIASPENHGFSHEVAFARGHYDGGVFVGANVAVKRNYITEGDGPAYWLLPLVAGRLTMQSAPQALDRLKFVLTGGWPDLFGSPQLTGQHLSPLLREASGAWKNPRDRTK
jgi:hypothetical protein